MGFGKAMKTKIQTVLFGVSKLYFVLFIPPYHQWWLRQQQTAAVAL